MSPELIEFSRRQIRGGSKSFAFASLFFSKRERACAWLLYAWCRYCDDQIDGAPTSEAARERLADLEHWIRRAAGSAEPLALPQAEGLRLVLRECELPIEYPLDLLRGMRMDIEGYRGRSLPELLDYCYCVAGVVGLMMCHIMGVSDRRALRHALHLGQAMQLSNICRDFDEDWRLGRVYVPGEWLAEHSLGWREFDSPTGRGLWPQFARRILELAEKKYRSGREGLSFLPFRAAWAVAIALGTYRRIGEKVRSRGPRAWDDRCFTSPTEKAVIALVETLRLWTRLFPRLLFRWKPVKIEGVWRES